LRLNPKDRTGVGIVTVAVMVLAIHTGDGHQRSHTRVDAGNVGQKEMGRASDHAEDATLALVGFHVVEGDRARADQTIVIRGDRVLEVGEARSFDLPAGAHSVSAQGDEWIVAPGASTSDFRPLSPGSAADLLVLSSDPRSDPQAVFRPVGFVDAGVWATTERRSVRSAADGGSR
jgi:imidazolonepropionase-like amidohydrolase